MSQDNSKKIVNVRHSRNGKLSAESSTWRVPPSSQVTRTSYSANKSVSAGTGMDAAHTQAKSHGGANNRDNLNLTDRRLNRGVQQKNEVAATKAANQGHDVRMTRTAIFDRNNPMTVHGKPVPRAFLADKTTVNGVATTNNKVIAHIPKTTPEARQMAGIKPNATPAKVLPFPAQKPTTPPNAPAPTKPNNPLSAAKPTIKPTQPQPAPATAKPATPPTKPSNPLSAAKPASPPPSTSPSGGTGGRAGGKV